jgi:hypothetical protein
MIWRSLICSSLLLAAGLSAATVSGSIELRESRSDAVSRHRDFSGVFISLQDIAHPVATVPE